MLECKMIEFSFRVLFCLNYILQTTFSRSIRSKRFVDFSIQCNQNEDFTWDCFCPQRNVILTLRGSDDAFVVCGLDFKLSLLSKTPQQFNQQLAADFQRRTQYERPNMFKDDDHYRSKSYNLDDVRNPDGFAENEGEDFRNLGHFRNPDRDKDGGFRDTDWKYDNGGYNNENDYERAYARKNDDYQINRELYPDDESSVRRKHFPFYNSKERDSKTTPGGLISEEALDRKLESVLSNEVKNEVNSDLSRSRIENNDKEDLSKEKPNINEHYQNDLNQLDTSISTTLKYQDKTNGASSSKKLHITTSVPIVQNVNVETITSSGNFDFGKDDINKPVEESLSNLLSRKNVEENSFEAPTGYIKETTTTKVMGRTHKSTILDIKEHENDKMTQSFHSVIHEIGCKYEGRALSIGESISLRDNCKMVCVDHNIVQRVCPRDINDQSDSDSNENKNDFTVSGNGNDKELDEIISSFQVKNKTSFDTKSVTNATVPKTETENLTNSPANINSTDDGNGQTPTEDGCSFAGKSVAIGESIQLNYACKMICLHKNSMKRDCSGIRRIENIRDPNFSFAKWTP